jgi:hypothetical protein
MKAGGKQSNRQRDTEESELVPVGLHVGQNEPPVPIGSQIQLSEPIGDKEKITSRALKMTVCAGLGKDWGEVISE